MKIYEPKQPASPLTSKRLAEKNLVHELIQPAKTQDAYKLERIKIEREAFFRLTQTTKEIYEKIRLQCKEQTNSFAYRIFIIFDVMDIDITDDEINTICCRY